MKFEVKLIYIAYKSKALHLPTVVTGQLSELGMTVLLLIKMQFLK